MVDHSGALLESQTLLAAPLDATHITQPASAHDLHLENAPLANRQICASITPTQDH